MKKTILNGILYSGAVILLITSCNKQTEPSQNLIFNGSTELPKYDSVPVNWLNVQGHWISLEGDSLHHDFGFAQDGKYYFFAGNDTLGILQQDVNVSDYAGQIDEHTLQFIFNGYVQSLDQGPNSDQSQIILTGLDNSKTKITNIYTSDSTRSISKWLLVADTFKVSASTRFIRLQLIAIRHVGGDNDGYFDNMSLVALPVKSSFNIILIIIAALVCLLIIFIIIRKRSRLPAAGDINNTKIE